MKTPSPYVCQRCGLNVSFWYFGWKHQAGWRSKKSCGQKPIPVLRAAIAKVKG